MKKIIILFSSLLISVMIFAQNNSTKPIPNNLLIRIQTSDYYEIGNPCGYKNQKGDTIIPFNTYSMCYTDTIRYFGIVKNYGENVKAIDGNGTFLFEVYWDNGPDKIYEDRFRIIENGKIGYANSKGEIIIKPQFECADAFYNGKAKVAYVCENSETNSTNTEWFYINLQGEKVF